MHQLFAIFLACWVLLSCQSTPPTSKLNLMSFNIRYDNPNDSPHDWANRRDSVASFIRQQSVDILGTQEVLHNQIEDLAKQLQEYKYIGVGRLDGKTAGEYATIWYRKARFQLVESSNFWLSATPEVAGSVGWDAACERICSWAKLHDKLSGDTLMIANTHLDHVGSEARKQSIHLIQERLSRLSQGKPIILMGDFNMPPSDTAYQVLIDQGATPRLYDSRELAKERLGAEGTFHNFGKIAPSERQRIDYILISKDFTVLKHKHLSSEGNAYCLSDHDAIFAQISTR